MRDWYPHRSKPAQLGRPRGPAGSFAPRRPAPWRTWLVLPGLLLTLSPFLSPAPDHCAPGLQLHQFRHRGDP